MAARPVFGRLIPRCSFPQFSVAHSCLAGEQARLSGLTRVFSLA